MRRIFYCLGLAAILFLNVLSFGTAQAASGKDIAEDFDNYLLPVFPAVYGEIINALPADEVANISTALRGVEFFGYLKSMGDVALAIDAGDNKEAAIETASTLVKGAMSYVQYKGVTQIAVMGSSVGMLPLTALVTAIDITRSSYKAVEASRIGVELEQLYGSVEYDRELKDTNRKLGEGDPIKINQQTIDRLWRKVIYDPAWARLFKTYVVSELGADWPEPSLWDRLTVPSNVLRDAALFEEQKRLKSHIATLLIELNKVAQKREAEVVLAHHLREMAAIAMKIDPAQMTKALQKYHEATVMLPLIKRYADELPQKVKGYESLFEKANTMPLAEFMKQFEEEPSQVLAELRFKILEESQTIIRYVQVLRYVPENDKKIGGDRKYLLNLFKIQYLKLWPMRDSISTGIINTKLLQETKALAVDNTEFVFTRYMPQKGFDEYAVAFTSPVKLGSADAGNLVGLAKAAVTADAKKTSELYTADYKANYDIAEAKNNEINLQIKDLSERLASTTDSKQRDALMAAIQNLKKQQVALKNRWEKYKTIYSISTAVDKEHYAETLREIDQFVVANSNRYRSTWESIEINYRDAAVKYQDFGASRTNTSRHPQAFLSPDELSRLKRIMRDNPGGYVGIPEDFLSRHIPDSLEGDSRTVIIRKAVEAMRDEITRQNGIVSNFRMEYYESWEVYTLPSLEFMGSSDARKELKNVEDALNLAISFLKRVSLNDISKPNQSVFKERLSWLEQMKKSLNNYKQSANLASGMAGSFKNYLKRAKINNEAVAVDSQYLSSLYTKFHTANSQLSMVLGYFTASTANRSFLAQDEGSVSMQPEILPSTRVVEVLDSRGILEYSRNSKLELEKLLEEAYAEIPTKAGTQTVTAQSFEDLASQISNLPTSSYAEFYPGLKKIIDASAVNSIIITFIPYDNFQAKFSFDPPMGSAAKKLGKALNEARSKVQKNQEAISSAAAQLDNILRKVNVGIEMAEKAIAANNYPVAAGLKYYKNTTYDEYIALRSKRKDIDDAFIKLQKLIELGEKKLQESRIPPTPVNVITEAQTKKLYQDFINAYSRGNVSQLTRLLANDWQGGDGADVRDVEEYLTNSFRVFERIQYRISGFTMQPLHGGSMRVTYTAQITGENRRQRLKHEENTRIIEEVGLVDGNPRILRTLSGRQWLK